jgi:hypothetical protein
MPMDRAPSLYTRRAPPQVTVRTFFPAHQTRLAEIAVLTIGSLL